MSRIPVRMQDLASTLLVAQSYYYSAARSSRDQIFRNWFSLGWPLFSSVAQHAYSRSNTRMFGVPRSAGCTVCVRVLKSGESSIC